MSYSNIYWLMREKRMGNYRDILEARGRLFKVNFSSQQELNLSRTKENIFALCCEMKSVQNVFIMYGRHEVNLGKVTLLSFGSFF